MKIPKTTLFFVLIPFATFAVAMLYLEMGPELGSPGQQALSGEVGSHPPRSKTTVLAVPHRFGEVIRPLLPEKPAPKGASIPAEEHSDRSRTIQAMAISPRPVELKGQKASRRPRQPEREIPSPQPYSPDLSISPSELSKLDVPSVCTDQLPGLDFEVHEKTLLAIQNAINGGQLQSAPPPGHRSPLGGADGPRSSHPGSTSTGAATSLESMVTPSSKLNRSPNAPRPDELSPSWNPHGAPIRTASSAYLKAAANADLDPHQEVFSRGAFPSATECKACHEQIYREWSVSGHAYAAISPMYQKFEQRINDLTQGTVGYFCMRCHAPVATTMEQRRDQAIYDGPRVFREGVTCVACHRVVQAHSKDNGERRIEPGDLSQPIVGSGNGIGIEKAKKYADFYNVKTDPQDPSSKALIHRRSIQFDQLSKSTFCVSCHQVAVQPGIALEVVWNQYRASPAYREGTSCQDCHMGRVPGLNEGYSIGPAAVFGGKAVNPDRKHSNHQFYGPGYSIAHPGIFPQNPDADKWTVSQWLEFDWRGGWGTEAFENALENGEVFASFPEVWGNVDDRMDARDIVDVNQKLLGYKTDLRRQVMENGAKLEGPYFNQEPVSGRPLSFFYNVKNISKGHNMPSGSLGAQPQLWLNVVLIGPQGNRIWESGYLDSCGDLADRHSADVLEHRIAHDKQLFNLQTKFLTTNVKGTDREMYLPVPFDFDQLAFFRPDTRPNTVMNHPPFIRMEAHSIPATGHRKAKYSIPRSVMSEPGPYRLTVRMRSRAEPIYFMKDVRATPEMIRSMNEGILDLHAYSKEFFVR